MHAIECLHYTVITLIQQWEHAESIQKGLTPNNFSEFAFYLSVKKSPVQKKQKCPLSQHDYYINYDVLCPKEWKSGTEVNHRMSLENRPKLLWNFMYSAHVNGQEQNKDTFGFIQTNMESAWCQLCTCILTTSLQAVSTIICLKSNQWA